jgi:hypothetical protein
MPEAATTPETPVTPEAANQPWYPDTVKDYVANKGWKAPADVITSYQSIEKLMGEDKAGRTLVLPKDDKDVEGQKAFRAKLGVPDSADKYELPAPAGEGGPNLIKEASAWFHEAGIPKAAAQAITSKWNAHIEGLIKAQETQAQTESHAQLEALKGEWGKDFDTKSEYARRFLKAAGWDDAKMAQYERTFGTATMLKDFFQWGSKVGEPGFASGSSDTSFAPAKAEVNRKVKELRDQRIAGQIDERTFHAQMSILGPQMDATA